MQLECNCIRSEHYNCRRKGDYSRRRRTLESGKPRRRTTKESIKQGCTSRLVCKMLKKRIANGSPIKIYHDLYSICHSHPLATAESVGTQYLPKVTRQKIEMLWQNGSPVREVLHRLRAKTDRFLKLDETRIFHDDIVTYKDVYSVYYKIVTKVTQKEKDEEQSAVKWMEELAAQSYYTCYEKGKYYGLSRPWQLQQLRDHGNIFCFDGTHNIYG
ncbi:hypothetical protein BGZ98_000748 [Dissophora globulifera]|nr:hypothetical protein BGZ98_000748 [Dissophora globulifera]